MLVACTAIAAASWDGNINYGSPSLRHEPLGINTHKVKRRMLTKRDGSYQHTKDVKFTHGVASVSSYTIFVNLSKLIVVGRSFC